MVDTQPRLVAATSCRVRTAAGQAGVEPPAAGAEAPANTAPDAVVKSMSATWLCIHHRPDDGARVRLGIRREGWEVHWPREVVRMPRKDDVLRPFFPGYMFARPLERHARWDSLRGAVPNVIGIVGVREHGQPVHPPRGFVEMLIDRAGGAIDGVIPAPEDERADKLRPGAKLRLRHGAWDGVEAVLEVDRGVRVDVLLTLLGVRRVVSVDRASVEVVG